jgi:hypothetical protein
MMRIAIGPALALASAVAAIQPATGQDKFEIPLGQLEKRPGPGPALSLGSVGVNTNHSDPYFRHAGNDPDRSIIPSERSATSAPGLLLPIPLGGSAPR